MNALSKGTSLVDEEWSNRLRRGIFVDIEATGLHKGSYPIEIGFAHIHTDPSGRDSVRSWSYLIRPHDSWDIDASWDPEAEKIHKIPKADLAFGEPVSRVVEDLDSVVSDYVHIFSDAPNYEFGWLEPAIIAGSKTAKQRDDLLGHLRHGISHSFYEGMANVTNELLLPVMQYLGRTLPNHTPHRAGPDAELMALQALGVLRHLEAGTIHQFEND